MWPSSTLRAARICSVSLRGGERGGALGQVAGDVAARGDEHAQRRIWRGEEACVFVHFRADEVGKVNQLHIRAAIHIEFWSWIHDLAVFVWFGLVLVARQR